MMILMLENPTDDSVEVTVAFLKECGAKLSEISPRGLNGKSLSFCMLLFLYGETFCFSAHDTFYAFSKCLVYFLIM